MKKIIIFLSAIIIIILAGAGVWKFTQLNKNSADIAGKDYKNISYMVDGKNVALVNGISEVEAAPGSASKIITRYFGNEAVGDFNGDGTDDVAFLLTQDGGGSGTFYYAVAALKTKGGYIGTNAIFLGDRIAPQTTEFRNGYVIVNYAERAQNEPMTAQPSIGKSKYFIIENNQLVEAPNPNK